MLGRLVFYKQVAPTGLKNLFHRKPKTGETYLGVLDGLVLLASLPDEAAKEIFDFARFLSARIPIQGAAAYKKTVQKAV